MNRDSSKAGGNSFASKISRQSVELREDGLIIRRKGLTNLINQGLKGEKFIPFSSITSIQFRKAGLITGFIQFGVAGGVESRGGIKSAIHDENTVLFGRKDNDRFGELKALIEAKMRGQGVTAAKASDKIAQIERLAALREAGHLTDGEFAAEKSRILGGS